MFGTLLINMPNDGRRFIVHTGEHHNFGIIQVYKIELKSGGGIDCAPTDKVVIGDPVNGFISNRVDPTGGSNGGAFSEIKLYTTNGNIILTSDADDITNCGIFINNLPETDPENVNQLWNDSGTLKISAGPS
jgi:hypothetical protein